MFKWIGIILSRVTIFDIIFVLLLALLLFGFIPWTYWWVLIIPPAIEGIILTVILIKRHSKKSN